MPSSSSSSSDTTARESEQMQQEQHEQLLNSVVDAVKRRLCINYVHKATTASKITEALDSALASGAYLPLATNYAALANTLTAAIQAAAGDKQLRVLFDPKISIDGTEGATDEDAADVHEKRALAAHLDLHSDGIANVDRLAGNVGYIAFSAFAEPSVFSPLLQAAFTLVAKTDALIVDLREGRGGSFSSAKLLLSYLVDGKEEGLPDVSGSRYLGKPVQILTSKETYSACEYFVAGALRALGPRVTTVGGSTAGWGLPTRSFRAGHPQLRVVVPASAPALPGAAADDAAAYFFSASPIPASTKVSPKSALLKATAVATAHALAAARAAASASSSSAAAAAATAHLLAEADAAHEASKAALDRAAGAATGGRLQQAASKMDLEDGLHLLARPDGVTYMLRTVTREYLAGWRGPAEHAVRKISKEEAQELMKHCAFSVEE
ncbi:ClpP/crotonase-like domain-containing protein [Zopfochytrium polystomum]|nr:ClpP/crotonase-like domain-containing protein [Zopfochytrium polystomum]